MDGEGHQTWSVRLHVLGQDVKPKEDGLACLPVVEGIRKETHPEDIKANRVARVVVKMWRAQRWTPRTATGNCHRCKLHLKERLVCPVLVTCREPFDPTWCALGVKEVRSWARDGAASYVGQRGRLDTRLALTEFGAEKLRGFKRLSEESASLLWR